MRALALLTPVFFATILFAAEEPKKQIKSPAQIQRELDSAQADFDTAKKMFSPFYSGPLLTGSANNCPPGHVNIEPYLFITDNYGVYTSNRKRENIDDLWNINPVFIFQTGLTKWLDVQITPQAIYNTTRNQGNFNWGDLDVTLGFQLIKETPFLPALRFTVTEIFPLGKYDHLDPDRLGTDGTGGGSFQTQFNLNISKVLWTFPLHPMQVRGNAVYVIPSRVDVDSFNTYGGGHGTHGTIFPGNIWELYASMEVTMVRHWVAALDLAYKNFNKTRFSGTRGTTPSGLPAPIGAPSGDQFSMAPAIEYNPSAHQQFIVGTWFTVTGRNSSAFVSLIMAYNHYW